MRTLIRYLGEFFGWIAAHLFKAWAEERRKRKGEVRQIGNDDETRDALDNSIRDAVMDDRLRPKPKD